MTNQAKPQYVDDPSVRETFVEIVQVLAPSGPVIMEFCVRRWTPDAPVHVNRITPVARLVMHPDVAKLLRDQITNALEATERVSRAIVPLVEPAAVN